MHVCVESIEPFFLAFDWMDRPFDQLIDRLIDRWQRPSALKPRIDRPIKIDSNAHTRLRITVALQPFNTATVHHPMTRRCDGRDWMDAWDLGFDCRFPIDFETSTQFQYLPSHVHTNKQERGRLRPTI